MKQILFLKIFLGLFLLLAGNGIAFAQNCTCAICGVSCNAPASAHTNPSCPVYKNYHYNKTGSSSSGSSLSTEQGIMLNLFSNVLGGLLSGSSNQDTEKARQAEEQRQKKLAILLAIQKRYNDSIAQVNHDRMMKEYKQLDGNGNLSYKGLDDKPKLPQVQFNCKITSFQGNVTVVKSNGQRVALSETQSADLAPGDWIATGENSRLKLHYAFEKGGEDIILGSRSVITIGVDEEGRQVPKLMKGNLYVVNNKVIEKIAEPQEEINAELAEEMSKIKNKIRKKFEMVRTPSAVCAVRGTEFTVHVDEFENTEVAVKSGIVDLTGNLMNSTVTLTVETKGIIKVTGEIIGPLIVDNKEFDNWDQN